jgi:rfaE bifunctional protein kinase chain/domain
MTNYKNKDFRDKIKDRGELKKLIGPRPRDSKVIMCHGAFDIVHPGHIRHLSYASERADVLIASLTSDAYITKAHYRPFVPQDLRATNLAALEMVDYVIIDHDPTPLENLKYLQPDFFAKGYEYFDGDIHPRTKEEIAVLESYGGEIILTPGDIVYSSSRLIELEPPRIAAEKLHILMETERVGMDDLRSVLGSFGSLRIHVVGDTIVDSYVYCSLIGSGTKTPTLSVKHEEQVDFVGGAAVVAKHLRKAGAQVEFTSIMGEDDLQNYVLQDLENNGVECHVIVDPTRPTTQKTVFISQNQRMLKVDKLDNRPIADKYVKQIQDTIKSSQADVFVFSDFRHGIFSRQSISQFVSSIPKGRLKVADSQVASRWGNILDFQGFDLITPNEKEARFSLGDQDSVVRPLALELYRRAKCRCLMLKMGERGLLTYRSEEGRAHINIDSFAQHVVDSVGSGDALLAYATLALAATKSDVIASILGSIAAAVACESEGNNSVEPDDILVKLQAIEKQLQYT